VALLSVVVPCLDEQDALGIFHEAVTDVIAGMPGAEAELLFVDDGSSDATLERIRELHRADPRVRYVSFSRNFGKEAAILAGLTYARGDYVALMDADMQDPPSLLPDMYAAVASGEWDCAAARRATREGEGRVRSMASGAFYKVFNRLSRVRLAEGARDYRLMSRQMVDAVLDLSEVNRFSKGLFSWVGFRTKWFEFDNVERVAGETKWSFFSLLKYSVEGIVDFSTAPLSLASALGFVSCAAALVGIVVIVVRRLAWGDPVQGWASLAVLILLVGGLQFLTIGILGQYLSRTYIETKHRPVYVVRETEQLAR
jgi:glycosyltransferase involved in cell wall biosynthesis